MSEKRRQKRTQLLYYLSVNDRSTSQEVGRVIDITTEGIRLISEATIPKNRIFNLILTLPEVISGKSTVEFDAKSIQSHPVKNSDFFDTGFQMLDITEADQNILIKLMDDFEFPTVFTD